MTDAIRGIMEKPDLFTPEKVLLPVLEKLAIPAADGPADIWAHCAQHYLQRSERPPEPPRDWTQNVTLPRKSPLIRELEAFARNPLAMFIDSAFVKICARKSIEPSTAPVSI